MGSQAAFLVDRRHTSPQAVSLNRVSQRFGQRWALQDVSIRVEPGTFVSLTGPSGSGKTTLLRLIHGQLRPTEGQVLVDGREVARDWRLTALRRAVAFVHQENRLLPRLTALENLAYALRIMDLGARRADLECRARESLAAVGLDGWESSYPAQLSAGQRQRLAIARGIAQRPVVLLADEPTANLDVDNAEHVMALLAALNAEGTTIVMASHDRIAVRRFSDQTIELREGQVVARGARLRIECGTA